MELAKIVFAILAGFLFVSSDTVVKLHGRTYYLPWICLGEDLRPTLLMLFLFSGRKINKLFKVNNFKL